MLSNATCFECKITSCRSYTSQAIVPAFYDALSPGCLSLVKYHRSEPVLVKVNASMPRPPSSACCTHPSLVDSVLSWLEDAGLKPVVAESSCLGTIKGTCMALDISGLLDVVKKHNVKLVNLDEMDWGNITSTDLSELYKWVHQFAFTVSVAKCKTHSMLAFTGCIKNLYGLIPGTNKGIIHRDRPDVQQFSAFLIDHYLNLRKVIGVMDGIVAMAGNGPTHGYPFEMGYIGTSTDIALLDTVFALLLEYPVEIIPFFAELGKQLPNVSRKARKLIEHLELPSPSAKHPTTFNGDFSTSLVILKKRYEASKPEVRFDNSVCNQCFECYAKCPVQAIVIDAGYPRLIQEKCVRCLCCLEVCAWGAVYVR